MESENEIYYKKYINKNYVKFLDRYHSRYPNTTFTFLDNPEYENLQTYIYVKCEKKHVWKATANALYSRGSGCPYCANCKKKTHEQFLKEFYEKYPHKKFIFLTEYVNNNTKMKIQCDKNPEHIWEAPPYQTLTRGTGCPHCNGSFKKTTKEFIKEFHQKFPEKKYKILGEYKSALTKIEVQCEHGHTWYPTPNKLLENGGCWECFKINSFKNHDQFVQEFHEKYPHKKFIFLSEYTSSKNKIKIQCDKNSEHIWEASPNTLLSGSNCPHCNYIQNSKAEQEIIQMYNNIFLHRDKSFGIEIDLLSHDYKFGIEYNGVLWHSFGVTYPNNGERIDKNKHLRKTQLLESKDYQLFYIKDTHWLDPKKKDIWISMISNKLGKSNRIFARKLKIVDLTTYKDFVNNFLEDNHLQGKCNYKFAYGLQNPISGEVYSIMTFGHSRFSNDIEYELLRFCTYKNFSIIGGASKILKYFEKVHQPKSLISYANRDWSQGNVYKQLGFKFIENTPVNYCYYDQYLNMFSRQQFMKHKLKNKLENFDENLTELENMLYNNYRIYYDTGNMKFVKNYQFS